MNKFVLGIDIGGTNAKFGLVSPQGRILARSSISTRPYNRDRKKLIKAVIDEAHAILARGRLNIRKIAGIGIGLPGAVDPHRGVVLSLPNIHGWKNVPLQKIFETEFGVKTMIENDVNMITLGEWKYGAGRGTEDLLCMTLGTGVGGGLILGGGLYRGAGFVAGEIGHLPINESGPRCNCGGEACFEQYVGNQQLLKKIERVFQRKGLTIPDVYALACRGDQKAIRFFQETAVHIGNALVGIINILNPPLVIIGGGVSNNHKFLFPTIRQVIKARAMAVQARMVKIVHARLGDDAGILGARVLLREGSL